LSVDLKIISRYKNSESEFMTSTAPGTISISNVPRQKLAEKVTQQLLEAVRPLAPGTKLPSEKELAHKLAVGRSTLREALNGLAVLGMVDVRHGQGTFISNAPPAVGNNGQAQEAIAVALAKGVTRDLLEARLIIEVAMVRLAAQRRTDVDLREMEAVLEVHQRSLDNPIKPASQFHVLLAEAARNEVLASLFQSFLKRLMDPRGPRLYEQLEDFAAWELAEHRGIYEAVRAGEPELAAERMRNHVNAMELHYRKVGSV
jgi:GntR family transcriptional regulator, transcriptional repressor for pyruvate dehydrogenase complex